MFGPESIPAGIAAAFGTALLLAACGGGSDDPVAATPVAPAVPAAATIQGAAATGCGARQGRRVGHRRHGLERPRRG